jgi:cytoskeleton protein RodZ
VVVTAPQTDQTVVLANAAAMGSLGTTKSNPSAELTDIVTFRAKGDSWVEVTDAKGTVVLRRTLAAGELVGASGVLPLAAVVGRADSTQVEVRGQAFDLSVLAKNNVARFEVK